jgi:protein O-GlcNAc transferase
MKVQDQNKAARARRLQNKGAALLEEGKAKEAIPHLEQAHKLDRGNVPILINLGGAYVLGGQHKKAVPILEAARDAEPDNVMIWINLGAAYLGNPILATPEQQEMAIAAFETALELDPAAPNVHYNLGLVHLDRDDIDRARETFQRALQVNPSDGDARYWLQKLEGVEEQEGGQDDS